MSIEEIKDLLEAGKVRAEKYLNGRATVTGEIHDYGQGAYLTIERNGRRVLIMLAGECCGPGTFLAGYFKWDPNGQALEKLLGYLMESAAQ